MFTHCFAHAVCKATEDAENLEIARRHAGRGPETEVQLGGALGSSNFNNFTDSSLILTDSCTYCSPSTSLEEYPHRKQYIVDQVRMDSHR